MTPSEDQSPSSVNWQTVTRRQRRKRHQKITQIAAKTIKPPAEPPPKVLVAVARPSSVIHQAPVPAHVFRFTDFPLLTAAVAEAEAELETKQQQPREYVAAAASVGIVADPATPSTLPQRNIRPLWWAHPLASRPRPCSPRHPPRPPPGPPPHFAPFFPPPTDTAVVRGVLLAKCVLPLLVQHLGSMEGWPQGVLDTYLALRNTCGDVVHQPDMYVLVLPSTPGSMIFAVTCMVFSTWRLRAWRSLWNVRMDANARSRAMYSALQHVPDVALQLLTEANGWGTAWRGATLNRNLVAQHLGQQRSFLRFLLHLNDLMVGLSKYERRPY